MSEPPKHCRRCDTDKPPSEFGKDASTADGKRSHCLACDREATRGQARPRTADRILRSRAGSRAMAQLRDRHRDEYETLYEHALTAARLEAVAHVAAAPKPTPATCPPPPVPLLKPWPGADQPDGAPAARRRRHLPAVHQSARSRARLPKLRVASAGVRSGRRRGPAAVAG